jgi:transcriptional regulator of acetoin/glycerol metabolism
METAVAYKFNSEDYQSKLKYCWLKFINNEEFDSSFMRPGIFDSWQVSRYHNVDPYNLTVDRLSGQELERTLKKHESLIEAAIPEIERLYSIIKGSNVYIILTNNEGTVLHSVGDKKNIILSGPYTRLLVGSSWKINEAGTNSISACLSEKKPVQIYGCEHYRFHYQTHTCSGAPIFNKDADLIGTINISAFHDEVTTHTLGMIINVAKNIEHALMLKSMPFSNVRQRQIEQLYKQHCEQLGMVLLDNDNIVSNINDQALKILGFKIEDVLNKDIFKLLKIEIDNENEYNYTFRAEKNIYDVLSTITIHKSPHESKQVNVSFYKLGGNGNEESVNLMIMSYFGNHATGVNKHIAFKKRTPGFYAKYTFESLVGSSPSLLKTIADSKNAAKHKSNILITGESGTGKEIFAHAIHNASDRADCPFIPINCGAIPISLAESELFGYCKGAFTGGLKDGAPGKFELANGGTIFLDEIGELPLSLQVQLLRVLESKEIIRLGGDKPIKLDVRIIAATNKDLYQAMLNNTFREDLYYRLNVTPIRIPPLRERNEDIIVLTNYFVHKYNTTNDNIVLDSGVYEALLNYSWPGNIRELSNVIENAVSSGTRNRITIENLSLPLKAHLTGMHSDKDGKEIASIHVGESGNVDDFEANVLISALEKTRGNVKAASALLGLNSRTMYRKLKKYDINPKSYRLCKILPRAPGDS